MHLRLVLLLILSAYILSSVALANAQLVENNLKDTTGIIHWIQEPSPSDEVGVIQVIDTDMIVNPNLVEQVTVTVWSYSDSVPKVITLDETKPDSGTFEGKVFFTNLKSGSNANTVFVENNNRVTAEYVDQHTQIGQLQHLDAIFFATASSPQITCIAPQVLDPATNTCITPTLTCVAPQILDPKTNTCVTPAPSCIAPQVLDPATNTCVTPPPICTAPQVLDHKTNTCVTPPPSCIAPQILDPKTNTCVTPPPSCVAPQVLDTTTNACVTPTPTCTGSKVLDPKTSTCVTSIPDWVLPVTVVTLSGGGIVGLSVAKGWLKIKPHTQEPPTQKPSEKPTPENIPSTFHIEIKAGMEK